MTGIVLLAVSLGGFGSALYVHAQGVNWYTYLPTFMVMQQARSDDDAAISELLRRHVAGTLDPDLVVELIPIALRQQGLEPKPPSIWACTNFLAAMDRAGRLNQEQSERFRDQMVTFWVEFRPRVRQGEEVWLSLETWIRGAPGVSGSFTIEEGELRIGEWTRRDHYVYSGSLSRPGAGGSTSSGVDTRGFEPGTYNLEYRAAKIFTNPSFERLVEFSAELVILPKNARDTVRLIDNPALANAFKQAFSITTSNKVWGGPSRPGMIYVEIAIKEGMPTDAAFELFARVGERETSVGTFEIRKGGRRSPREKQFSCKFAQIDADSFVPVLRPSVVAAMKTADICEIWNGELVLEPVEVVRPLTTEPVGETVVEQEVAP